MRFEEFGNRRVRRFCETSLEGFGEIGSAPLRFNGLETPAPTYTLYMSSRSRAHNTQNWAFGAELLKCCAQQTRTKSAKVGDGRPALSRAPGGPSTKRSSLLRPGIAAKAGAQRASAKRSSVWRRAQSALKSAKWTVTGRSPQKRSWLVTGCGQISC